MYQSEKSKVKGYLMPTRQKTSCKIYRSTQNLCENSYCFCENLLVRDSTNHESTVPYRKGRVWNLRSRLHEFHFGL